MPPVVFPPILARLLATTLLLAVAACATTPKALDNRALKQEAPSTTVRWRVDPGCMATEPLADIGSRNDLAARCPRPDAPDFTAVALSGGGVKAAIFSGEAMFYLQALGLLQRASVLSSVSGGSFAAAMYALSCDPGDTDCAARTPPGLRRPPWRHDTVLPRLGTGYSALVHEQIVRLLVPLMQPSVSADRFADIIDRDYLNRADGSRARFTFADLNPRRPHLFLNSTIVSEDRGGLGAPGENLCMATTPRGYLRRRTPDELFHFAFSDFYFNALRSDLRGYAIARAVAASAAFPALIDNAELRDFCTSDPSRQVIRLMDGGVNDNQGLIEIYAILAELALGQARSDHSVAGHVDPDLETLTPRNHAWLFAINSSVTDSTGQPGTRDGEQGRSWLDWFMSLYTKVTSATDTYSAVGYVLRKQLYLAERDRVEARAGVPGIYPVEITLAQLDHYRAGGSEAFLRERAQIGHEPSDIADGRIARRRASQRGAYDLVVHNGLARRQLRLSDWHPQCYFKMRADLDQLVSLTDDQQACLREATRWSVALRAQELCDLGTHGGATPEALDCGGQGGLVRLAHATALDDTRKLAGTCHPVPDTDAAAAQGDPDASCVALAP